MPVKKSLGTYWKYHVNPNKEKRINQFFEIKYAYDGY